MALIPNNFRTISFPRMLYNCLTAPFSINASNLPTSIYKYCAAFLGILQQPWLDFIAFRNKQALIASCKFTVGQLTNVLNFLYDPTLNRIYIVQSVANPEYFWQFAYPPSMFLGQFGSAPLQFLRGFDDLEATSLVTIHVPAGADIVDLTATVAAISIEFHII